MGGNQVAGNPSGTKIVLVTERVPPETLEQLEAQVRHFATLPAPLLLFGGLKAKS